MNLSWLLVAIVYSAGVFAVRRGGGDLPRRVALLFGGLVFAFLWQPLTQRVVIVPADVIRLVSPWAEVRAPGRPPVTKYDVSNLNLHDVPMQIVPWMHQVRESWLAGKVPLWNAAAGCGHPLMANGQSTPFSPFHLLTLPLPLAFAITAEAALKLLLALVLTYLFCRRRYSPLASVIAAIAYGFSTWMVTWLQFPIATAAAFLPGVLIAIEDLMARPRSLAFPVFLFAATVVSGHPETVFHIGLIAAMHGLWIANRRGLLRVAAACALAAVITAPYLVPFTEAVVRSQRFAEVRGKADIGVPYSDGLSAVLLLQPRFFGHLPIERPWGPTTLETVCGFAGILAIASVVAASIFIVRRRRWRDRETLYLLGTLLCLGVVLAWPGLTQLFDAVAGLAPPMRMRLGLCWFPALLLGAVVDWTRREGATPILAGALAAAVAMLVLLRTTDFPSDSHRVSALLSLLPSVAVLAAVAFTAVRKREAWIAAGALSVVELWSSMSGWNPVQPLREFYPKTPLIAQLEKLPRTHRFVGMGGQVYPNLGAMWGLEDVRVHDPMADQRYVQLLAAKAGWNPADYYAKWTDPTSPLLDRLNVKYVVEADGRITINEDARERFYSDSAAVTIIDASEDSYVLKIAAKQHSLIASSVTSYPGWSAGTFRMFEHDGPFLAFMVPPGEHEVRVRYRPLSFYLPLIPAVLATGFVLWQTRRARRPR